MSDEAQFVRMNEAYISLAARVCALERDRTLHERLDALTQVVEELRAWTRRGLQRKIDKRKKKRPEWDYEALAETLRGFKGEATRLLSGFDAREIEPLLAAEWSGKPPEDAARGGLSKPKTKHRRRTKR